MSGSKRLIIPTADERTWRFDRPVLFLGSWCCRAEKAAKWSNLNAAITLPYGLEREQRESDFKYVQNLEEKLFLEVYHALNEINQTEHGERYWMILIGSWLRDCISLLFNRTKTTLMLETFAGTHSIVGPSSNYSYNLATLDSADATWAVNNDLWNHFLILEIIDAAGIKIERIPEFEDANVDSFKSSKKVKTINKISVARKTLNAVTKNFTRETDALIISTYLSLKAEILLQIVLGQSPRWLAPDGLDMEWKTSKEIRELGSKKIIKNTSDPIENVIRKLIFLLIPICYLEGYNRLQFLQETRQFPKKPKFIFTSNSFQFDEEFKMYTAKESELKTPIIYGQHGNNYGTAKYISPTIEEITSDKFLTWGWGTISQGYVPAFLLRNASLKLKKSSNPQKLLLIENSEEHRRRTWDTHVEYKNFLQEQKIFCSNLEIGPKTELLVRLSPVSEIFLSGDKNFWKEFDKTIQTEDGKSNIYSLFGLSKLVVHSYDSTGLLETLSKDIPSIAFWQNNLDHVCDSILIDYERLVDVGIIHLSPESAAEKVNEIWDNVNKWWIQESVQNARRQFCAKYARISQHPIRNLKKILLDNSNKL